MRDRKLRPGPGADREEVVGNQRERLFGAMVASVTERGYAETTLDNLVEISGVSRRTLYNLFDDKQACFRATLELLLAASMERASIQGDPGISWEDLTRVRFKAFVELVVAEPAASRMALIESHIAGPDARRPVDAAIEIWEQVMARRFVESPGRAGMPPEAIGAFVGGTLEIIRDRLGRGREAELSALIGEYAELLLSYRAPSQPLRSAPRGRSAPGESIESPDHRDRAIRALAVVAAEKGYSEVTVTDVVSGAAMSPGTFYANFSGKEDLMAAAIESAGAQIVAVAIPSFRRHEDWRLGTRSAIDSVFNLLASRPGLARLFLLEIYAAGTKALQLRDETLRPLRSLLPEAGGSSEGEPPPITPWAIAAGAYALTYRQLLKDGVDSLRGLTPICTYLALAPYIGAEEASRIANESGGQRRSVGAEIWLFDEAPSWPTKRRLMALLHARPSSAAQASRALGVTIDTVRSHLAELEDEKLVAPADGGVGDGDDRVYDSTMRGFDEAEWEQLGMDERIAISTRIVNLMFGEAEEALRSGNFEARPERHLSRIAGRVDEEGFRRLAELHDETLRAAMEILLEANARLEASGERGLLARGMQAVFEAPEITPD